MEDPAAQSSLEREAFAGVRSALLRVNRRLRPEMIRPEAVLEDLGVDSLKMVGLALAIEEALQIAEFPMQAWIDQEAAKLEGRYSVASLTRACARCMNPSREPR